ncbi:MAG: tyrosine-type recombinase/integrase, partial [Alphaproteobacteria bacterium]|nr:tyrosine-type recombinase/integrase [Alphaproteobacteria bacterium]
FIEDQGRCKAPSTMQRRLYAVRKVHRLLGYEDPTYAEKINLSLRRVRRSKPIRPKQAKGLTRPYLDRFLASEPDTPWGLRNRAMMSLGYELLTRRSELVALKTEDLGARDDGTLRVLIRRSKTDPDGAGRIAFTSKRTADIVREWITWRGPEIDWLFCPIYHGQPIDRSLETATVKRLVKNAARRSGLDPSEIDAFSGHSMRVGAAQDLLTRGFETAAIMRAGGWKSINILARYLEQAEHNIWA